MGNITSVLLVGGQSKRMGQDKAFLILNGETFLRKIVKSLIKYSSNLILIGNKEIDLYKKELKDITDFLYIKDISPYDGPLNAVVSSLPFINNDYIFLSTCDTPFLNPEIIKYFRENIGDYEVVIAEINKKYQFLNALYKKEALFKAKDLYQQGKKSLFALFEILNVKIINQEEISYIDKDLLSFWSINTPQDYEKAKIVNSSLKASLT